MANPLDFSSDQSKRDACHRLELLGASIGPSDEESIHVELKPCWGKTPIGDAEIPSVVQDVNILGNAAVLDLSETAITDAALPHLKQLRIPELWLYLTKMSAPGIAELEVALPDTAVSH